MQDQENISPIDQYVIDFVFELRRSKKHTQQDIADILQVSRSFVKDVENIKNRAKYNLSHINALADYYNMRPGDFLPDKAIPVNKSKEEKKTASAARLPKSATLKTAKTISNRKGK